MVAGLVIFIIIGIYIISIVITLAVAFLILGPRPSGISSYTVDVSILPFINASLNFLTSIFLVT